MGRSNLGASYRLSLGAVFRDVGKAPAAARRREIPHLICFFDMGGADAQAAKAAAPTETLRTDRRDLKKPVQVVCCPDP